ncbi:hypothetical protein LCGC14_0844370 [marine sediment metagenome]|uniref:Uncharacterized protein n=1 Tax=marine sediment metagenome TaxID=412755 RepID=A0A0F9PGY4_9ZZZZ
MGGTTITVYGVTEHEVLDKLRDQIKIGVGLGLYPDSVAVIINGDDLNAVLEGQSVEKNKAKLFSVNRHLLLIEVDFEDVEKGSTFHVGVAARFSRAPEAGELLGTIHLHT